MRLMSMVALVAAIMFGLITLLHSSANDENGLYLTAAFLVAAFAPKALQKFAEAKFPQFGSGSYGPHSGKQDGPRHFYLESVSKEPCAYLTFQKCVGQDEQEMKDQIGQALASRNPQNTPGGGLKCAVENTQDFLDLDAQLRELNAAFEYTLASKYLDQDITRTKTC